MGIQMAGKAMKHIAVYIRSSTTKQENGLDSQRKAVQSFLDSKGYQDMPLKVYEDVGVSGSHKNRPALTALLHDVQGGRVSLVVCYSFSRISRSIRDLIEIVELFESAEVKFHSLSESVDTSTPIGRCFLNIMAALHQVEIETLSERTKNGLKAAVARGSVLGRRVTRNATLIHELRNSGY